MSGHDNFDAAGNRKKDNFIGFLKRAFSTDDFDDSFDDNIEPADDNVLQYEEAIIEEDTPNIDNNSASKPVEDDGDPMEDEELLMIDAFFKGEEFVPSKPSKPSSEFDSQSAYEEEDVVFVVEDENINTYDESQGEEERSQGEEERSQGEDKDIKSEEEENEEDGKIPASFNDNSSDDMEDMEEKAAENIDEGGASDIETENNGDVAQTAESGSLDGGNAEGEGDNEQNTEPSEKTADEARENTVDVQNTADEDGDSDTAPAAEELTVGVEDEEDEEFAADEDEFLFDESEEDTPHSQDEEDIAPAIASDVPEISETAEQNESEEISEPVETAESTAQDAEDNDGEKAENTDNGLNEDGMEVIPSTDAGENKQGGFFKNAKNKIIEIWNTKVDEENAREAERSENAFVPPASNGGAKDIAQKAKEGIAKLAERFKKSTPQTVTAETPSDEWVYSEENLFTDTAETVIENSSEDKEREVEEAVVEETEVEKSDEDEETAVEKTVVEEAVVEEAVVEEAVVEEAADEKTVVEEAAVEKAVVEEAAVEKNEVEETDEDEETVIEKTEVEETDEDEETVIEKRERQIKVISGNRRANDDEYDKDELRSKLNVVKADIYTPEQRKIMEDSREEYTARVRELEERLKSMEIPPADRSESVPVVSELDIDDYRPVLPEVIKFPEGSFKESVRFEYECIVNYRKMRSVSTKEALAKDEPEPQPIPVPDEVTPISEAADVQSAGESEQYDDETAAFARSHDKVESIGKRLDDLDERSPEPIEYRSEDDVLEVRKYLAKNRATAMLTFGATGALTAAAFLVACFASKFSVGAGAASIDASQRLFALVNLLLFGGSVYFCRDMIIGGLLPLKKFKANADTLVSAAAAAEALQLLLALIAPRPFMGQGLNVYAVLVMLAMTANCAGNYFNAERISANFRFVSDDTQKYAGKFFHDQRMVVRLLSGTKNDKTELTFQKKTAFLKHFIKLSNEPDPGVKLSGSFARPVIVIAAAAAIGTLIFSHSFFDAISVLCIMLCVGIPMSARMLASLPLYKLAKRALLGKSMVVGYKAVETFAESAAVMIDARDLYPEGSVQLSSIKVLDAYRWQEAVYSAAALANKAGSAMAGIFGTVVERNKDHRVKVESFVYEDGKGLVGWVNNEQICVGNRELLISHGIPVMPVDDEDSYRENGDELLYIASSGRLVGFLLVGYTANLRVSDVLKRMEASEMSLLVRTTDVNITAEKIAKDFGIGMKSIKILEQKNSNVIRDEMVGKERSSPAFIATKGGVTSFGLAISECIQAKRSITLSEAIEIVGALLKLLVVSAIVMFSGIHHVGAAAIAVISLLWGAAVIFAPSLAQGLNNREK